MIKKLMVVLMVLGLAVAVQARPLRGQSTGGTAFEVEVAGGRNSPIDKEMCAKIEEAFGEPLVIVMVTADNRNGQAEFYNSHDAAILDTAQKEGLTPVDIFDAKFGFMPQSVRSLFYYAKIAKGQQKIFLRAFATGGRGSAQNMRRLQLRNGLLDDWTSIQ